MLNVTAAPKSVRFGFVVEITFYDPRKQIVHRTETTPTVMRSRQDAERLAAEIKAKYLSDSIMAVNAADKKPRRTRRPSQPRAKNTRYGRLIDGVLVYDN